MSCHYQLAITYGVAGQIGAAQAMAAIVKAKVPGLSIESFLDPRLAAIWQRGKELVGLA
jgi:hypothetical protein